MYGALDMSGAIGNLGAFSVVALVLAVLCTVLAFIYIVPEKGVKGMNGFMRALHDIVNFKYLIIEKILQALYIFVTCFVILCGFFLLFVTVDTWYETKWMGGYGILLMILGPIAVRLFYELMMMLILLVKNVIAINAKLSGKDGADGPSAESMSFAPSAGDIFGRKKDNVGADDYQTARFCSKCGAALDKDGHCPNCGDRG